MDDSQMNAIKQEIFKARRCDRLAQGGTESRDDPLVDGGQGRTASEVASRGEWLVLGILAGAGALIAAAAWATR